MTGKSLIDLIKDLGEKSRLKKLKKEEKKDKLEITKVEEEYENDNRVVISSMEELINLDKKEDKVVEQKEENSNIIDLMEALKKSVEKETA